MILIAGSKVFPCYAVIDSGADDCVFPASFGRALGLNIRTGKHYPFAGIGSGGHRAYFFDIQLEIAGVTRRHRLPIGFTKALESQGLGLLGQNGFFDRFTVCFSHSRQRITIHI